ncbi:MAG TPA: sugar phosphate isomerase/epimerase [Chloroflexota bacterium]|nr:sugar phosphate isomerase/epimerase [Chloroflexota bacterium]
MAALPIAVQLYTLRDELAQDFAGTLRRVAEIGYRAVELYSYGGMSAPELRALLHEIGLRPVSSHISLETLESDPERAIAFARELGCSFAGCPYLPEHRRGDAAAYRSVAATLTRCGAIARDHGLSFFYHHHDFEFQPLNGRTALDVLLEATHPDLVGLEVDVYWVAYAGLDPAAFMRTLGRRCRLLHLKDMAPDAARSFAEIGEGTLDLDAVVAAGQEVGVQWYIVEQDRALQRTPLEAIRLSLENLKAKGWA